MIKINFDEIFEPIEVTPDLTGMKFYSILKNGDQVLLKVEIKSLADPLLPNVFNLAFGPSDEEEKIDDQVKLNHSDINKMFSTILLFSLTFLKVNPSVKIGIDGSNDVRAYLYHRMFLTNKNYLNEFFVTIGVDWYVRLLRDGTVERDHQGLAFFKPKPEPFDYQRTAIDLYRYYMFLLRPK
ncbi:DUF6934 family protein [Chitinophaga defluvii]|uniref:Uncharacterized protein n=1 Tax=Chitinophaga defluvii TaxID=3163343 RepID=A0ABV2T475_9BACT